jgi:predicted RNA-binding Zn-ribbon protein involved in translation (DUF1610 family)
MLSIDSKYIRLVSFRLRNFKQKKDYLWNFSCPVCGDSQKNLRKARGYVFQKGTDLFYNCHNCGVGLSLGNLLKHIDPSIHKEYLMERYVSGKTNSRNVANAVFNISPPKFDKVSKQKIFEHAEWISNLPEGHFCLDYVRNRQIPTEHYDKLLFTPSYKRFCDALIPSHGKKIIDDARLVIPFYDEYNELIAISGRALETNDKTLRYVTIRTTDSNSKLVYGIDRVDFEKPVILVEGPIDSLFLNNCLAAGDANLSQVAKEIGVKSIILVWDNECRNKEIVKMMQDAIGLDYSVAIWPDNLAGKDINEIILNGKTSDEVEKIISSNVFKGLKAQVQLNNWKKI